MTNQNGPQEEEEEGGVGEMKRGDYMIHIFLEKSRDFKVPENGTVDPIFEIQALGEKTYSSAKDDIGGLGEITWSEHIFIEAKNIEKKTAEDGKITITLQDKGIFKNDVIGLYEFDLSFIYFMKNHVMLHKWLAFSNPNSENYSEVTGYLKLSINVTCTGDESVQIEDDDGPEDTNVLMPPSLNPKFFQVKLRFFEAQQIPPMDMGMGFLKKAKTDAYVMTQYKNKKLKSNVLIMGEDTPSIEWNQEFWIPAQVPVISKRMTVKVMDQDDVKDEVVGSLLFDIQDIVDGKFHNKFFWMNIYGSPLNQSNSQAKRDMNENPELASNWKGRVLMQIECFETEKPVCKVANIDDEIIMEAKGYTNNKKYQMIAEVGQAVALPYNDKFSVKILVGGEEFQTQKAKVAKKDYNRFNERFEQRTVQSPYTSIEEFGDLFVILMDDDKPICFFKDNIMNYTDPDAKYHWISFKPDLCVNKVKNANLAGMISFKFSIHKAEDEEINFKEHAAWKKMPPKRLEPVKIRAYIYQCRDLPAADANGTSDPYVQVWDMSEGKPKRTQTIEDNNNPLFYEVIELDYEVREIDDLESYPPFILDVFDADDDLMDSTDDFLARAIVEPEDCVITKQKEFEIDRNMEIPVKPKWHELHFMPGEPKSGEILVSFSVSQIDYNYMHPAKNVDLSARVEFKEFDITMLILGLRQLESPGILPVRKAFIQFNMKSLVPPNSTAIQNIQTQPQNSGPNPTINTTMNVTIPLPTDPLYCPQLTSIVYDYIFKGFNQPMVGVFTIPIGQYMLDLKAERKRETQEIENINKALQGILEGELAPQQFDSSADNNINKTLDKNDDQPGAKQIRETSEVPLGFDDEEMQGQRSVADLDESSKKRKESNDGERTSTYNNGKRRRKKGTKTDQSLNKALSGTQFGKDASESFGVDADDAEYKAEKEEEKRLEDIANRKRTAKASYLQHSRSQASMSNLDVTNINDSQMTKLPVRMDTLQKEQLIEDLNPDRMPSVSDLAIGVQSVFKAQKQKRESILVKNDNMTKTAIKEMLQHDKDQEKRIHEDQRKRAEEDMLRENGQDTFKNVIMPKYIQDKRLKVDREHQQPANALYLGLGWDEDRSTQRKHYRRFYDDELENIDEIFPVKSPFHTIELKKGQSRGLPKGMFASMMKKAQKKDASGQDSNEKVCGYFKGIVEVESRHDRYEYDQKKATLVADLVDKVNQISMMKQKKELKIDVDLIEDPQERKKLKLELRKLNISHLQITSHLTNLHSEVILKRQLMASNRCIIRCYMISAFNLSSRDNGSASDPYLVLKCNNKTYNERSNYQLDEPNPKFLKYYDFEGVFPGCSPLQIDVWDYDDIFGDDLIGTTIVDLEDRYFTLEWQSLHEKPIEYRQIYHESSSQEQGVVKTWIEINSTTVDPSHIKVWDISEKPAETFEVRICVFNAVDMAIMDWEGTSDVFFRGFFDSKEDVQETDTHYRNQDGKPDFQYRLVYRLEVPRKDYKFSLQAYDRDFFKSNDMIGEAQINLKQIIEDTTLVKKPLCLNEQYYNDVLKPQKGQVLDFDDDHSSRFWLKLRSKNAKTGKEETKGKVLVQVDVLPLQMATKNPVGKARDNPNHSPTLPQPEGRIKLSLNPFTMFNQLVGPEVRRKICICLCLALCLVLTLALAPNMIGSLIANWLTKPFSK